MLSKVIVLGGVFAALAVTLGGCSSDSKPAATAAPIKYPDIGVFCTAIGLAECSDKIVSICAVPDKTTCQGAVDKQCTGNSSADGKPTSDITFGRNVNSYQAAKGEACVVAVQAAYADGDITAAEYAAIRTPCDLAFSDLLDVGSPCTIDADCDIGQKLICTVAGGSNKCEKPGTETGDCTNAACMPPLVCGPSNYCVPGRHLGNPCVNPTDPCESGLLCESGSCVTKHGAGSPCASSTECASGFCARVPDYSNPMMPNPDARICLTELQYGTGLPLCANFK